ncbi:MAG: hypothetical protein QHH26_04065 [Armatimonadota bacterium]|nr:hypothetical protein [Armatimonadota bacterium]
MNKIHLWQFLPYILPVISYVIGKQMNRLRVPREVLRLISNPNIVGIITQGVKTAQALHGKSDDEKREYVRSWAKSELYKLLGKWFPDSTINFLIEHVIIRRKAL